MSTRSNIRLPATLLAVSCALSLSMACAVGPSPTNTSALQTGPNYSAQISGGLAASVPADQGVSNLLVSAPTSQANRQVYVITASGAFDESSITAFMADADRLRAQFGQKPVFIIQFARPDGSPITIRKLE